MALLQEFALLTPAMTDQEMTHAGDTIQATPGEGWVSFMYSYPMMIPLPAGQVARIRDTVQSWPSQFEHLYGGWFGKAVGADAKAVVLRSADRYVGVLDGSLQKQYI